jgi:hypothetical protein
LVPGHAREQHSHAAHVRNPSEDQPGGNERGEPSEGRMDQPAQEDAAQDQRPRGDANLAFKGNRLASADDRKAGGDAGDSAAVDVDDIRKAGGEKLLTGLTATASRMADDVEGPSFAFAARRHQVRRIKPVEWDVLGLWQVDLAELGRSADVDEVDVPGMAALDKFLRTDGRDRHSNVPFRSAGLASSLANFVPVPMLSEVATANQGKTGAERGISPFRASRAVSDDSNRWNSCSDR